MPGRTVTRDPGSEHAASGPTTDPKRTVLFLCTGNAARSQMAEALARLDYPDLLEPISAGSRPAGFVHPLAIRAVEELGVGLEEAYSKSAEEFREQAFDLVVTVCDAAAADCPAWPGARHLVHWSIPDPSFAPGREEARLAAFRATRDDLRRRIDALMEALRGPHPNPSDLSLLERGAGVLEDVLTGHGFKRSPVREEEVSGRRTAVGGYRRRGRALELQVRTSVGIALYAAGDRRMLHPDYMRSLGVAGLMRYPGVSKDPLGAFRRLRADLLRFGEPFLSGRGLKEFARLHDETPPAGASPEGRP
jgi:arsenate reductase